jgi:transketolase
VCSSDLAILKSRRRLLLQKANELGGKELVNQWIDLHVVGEKKNQLIVIAKEQGFN